MAILLKVYVVKQLVRVAILTLNCYRTSYFINQKFSQKGRDRGTEYKDIYFYFVNPNYKGIKLLQTLRRIASNKMQNL